MAFTVPRKKVFLIIDGVIGDNAACIEDKTMAHAKERFGLGRSSGKSCAEAEFGRSKMDPLEGEHLRTVGLCKHSPIPNSEESELAARACFLSL